MGSHRFTRTVAVLGMSALVLGAFAATPADAKKKKPKACAAYQPGEKGTDKPTVTVTDAHTEEAALAQPVTLAESVADFDVTGAISHPGTDAFNVQVDTNLKEAGLYVLFEFPTRRDYDLELWHSDGSYAARSHDFNPIYNPVDPTLHSNEGHAGESTDSYEKIVGVRTSDCGGYTVEAVNWLGEGGDFEIKLWLGEIKNDAQEPGAEVPE